MYGIFTSISSQSPKMWKEACKSNYTIYFPGRILIYFFVCKMLFICIEGYIQDVWWSNVSQIAGGSVFISLKKNRIFIWTKFTWSFF